MQIIQKINKENYTDIVNSLVVGESLKGDYSIESALRGAIYRIQSKTDRKYTTKKIKGDSGVFLQITRTQ